MAKRSSRQKNRGGTPPSQTIRIPSIQQSERSAPDPASLPELPTTYQALNDYVERAGSINPFALRHETFLRIERVTQVPLICYVAKTQNLVQGIPAHIEDSDLIGFDDLVQSTEGDAVDIFLISNGGSAETTERIVKLLREQYKRIRFILPANAYSAATLMCLAGDEIIMDGSATLGPIDPQINGIPTRAILRAFEQIKEKLKNEGPGALTAYMPLLSKYDLHIFEMCKSAEELSTELAGNWVSSYMLKCDRNDPRVVKIVNFLADYDLHKSHARSIDRVTARGLELEVINTESMNGLGNLIRSLRNQYAFWFDKTPFFKMFENARGINWGRQAQQMVMQLPPGMGPIPQAAPQPGPPKRSG
jgi:hypothetical protein